MRYFLAYIDPGSGFVIWQSIAAAGLTSLFYLRKFFTKLRNRRGTEK